MPRRPSGAGGPVRTGPLVEVVPVEAARLLTLGEEHAVWSAGARDPTAGEGSPVEAGSFVRLRPPAGVPDSAVAVVKAACEARGARVKVERLPIADAVPRLAAGGVDFAGAAGRLREKVLELLEGAPGRDRIRGIVEEELAAAGL